MKKHLNNSGFTPLEKKGGSLETMWKLMINRFIRLLPNRDDRSLTGFTLIEILLVVIIIGILAGLVVPNIMGRSEEARRQAATADVHGGLSAAIDLYELDNGTFPENIEDLTADPGSARNWRGPYLKKGIPKDPWGNPYVYKNPGVQNPTSYDLSSAGPDGQSSTSDDIVNWETTQ